MKSRSPIGGVIHTYQKYDPQNLPSPRQPAPDVVSGAFEHLLAYGDLRELTDEELARAVRLDPSQIAGLGPSLDALMAMLRERKQKILQTYETDRVQAGGGRAIPAVGRADRAPAGAGQAIPQGGRGRATLRPGAALVSPGRPARPPGRRAAPPGGRIGRQVSGRRAGGQIRLHRPHADDHPPGAGNQGGAGNDRSAAETVGRGGQDGADRRDRHGGAGRVRRAGRHRATERAWPGRSRSISATWPSSRDWSGPPADTS